MSIKYEYGDLLESNCEYICHQVNCMGVMGSGIAKQIREKYPKVYTDYISWCKQYEKMTSPGVYTYQDMLGQIQIVDVGEYKVINMAAQYDYGRDGLRYTSYDAFWNCLSQIKYYLPKGSKIGFPYGIGCGLGGANWYVINYMIKIILEEDFEVYIYQLPWYCGKLRANNIEETFNKVGVSIKDNEGNIKPLYNVLEDLSNVWNNLTQRQQKNITNSCNYDGR